MRSSIAERVKQLNRIAEAKKQILNNSIERELGIVQEQTLYEKLTRPVVESIVGVDENKNQPSVLAPKKASGKPSLTEVLAKHNTVQTQALTNINASLATQGTKLTQMNANLGNLATVPVPATATALTSVAGPSTATDEEFLPPLEEEEKEEVPEYVDKEAIKNYDFDNTINNWSKIKSNKAVVGAAKTGILAGLTVDGPSLSDGKKRIFYAENSEGKKTPKVPLTPGLAELLFADKMNLRVIEEKDKIAYLDILNSLKGKKATSIDIGNNEKAREIRQLIPQVGHGIHERRPDTPYHATHVAPDGKFGRIRINLEELEGGTLEISDPETGKILQKNRLQYPKEVRDLLVKKRISRMDLYTDPEMLEEYNGILKIAHVIPKASFRHHIAKVPPVIVSGIDDALQQLSLSLSEIDAGNTNKSLKNHVISILDFLLKNRSLTKKQYKEISQKYSLSP